MLKLQPHRAFGLNIMPDLLAVQYRAFPKVPVEVWLDIFELVTSVPRKYEFTMDGAAYVMANKASRAETGIPTSEEAAEITRSRLPIVLVCKNWYAIGIQALWSHLRIDVCTEPIRAIERIQEAINRDATIASYVIRITLEESRSKRAPAGVLDGPLQRLTSQLPSLQIVVCPGIYACGMEKSSIDIVVWKQIIYPPVFRRILEQTTYMQNTRVLSIVLVIDNQLYLTRNTVLFPRLESLSLSVYHDHTIAGLTRSWEIPNLKILSVQGLPAIDWLDLIEKWSANIDVLELPSHNSEWPRSIQLPKLKELHIREGPSMPYRIAAPKIERLCLNFDGNYPPKRDDIIKAVDRARTSFPTLLRLRFRGQGTGSVIIDYSLTSRDIRSWKEEGLGVDVLLSQFGL
jgi:hypothetical protein